MREFDQPGRSVVYSSNGMVASSQTLASSSALNILRSGGNAIDAAISAAALLAVIEPTDTSIGGDCFVLYSPKGKSPPLAFNGSGKSPSKLTLQYMLENGFKEMPHQGPHTVTTPGAIDAWWQIHQRFGKLDFEEILLPAINHAENGYVVHERLAHHWNSNFDRLDNLGDAKSIFLNNGIPPSAGQKMKNPALAQTLKKIAKKGRKGFYEGEIAETIVAFLNEIGGLHSLDDFYNTSGEFVEPISAEYKNNNVYQLPPNTQGIIALIILKILNNLNIDKHEHNSAERTHLLIEASRIAYNYRNLLLGDFNSSEKIINILNDDKLIFDFSQNIKLGSIINPLPPIPKYGSNTIYLSVVDKDQNMVSFINSIFEPFGSGLVPTNTGTLLQNRGHSFSLDKDHPNCIASSKRPMHTIIPAMLGNDNKINLTFGVMGGDYQPMGHSHFLSSIIDHNFNIQEALDAPRFLPIDNHVDFESSFPNDIIKTLSSWGHEIRQSPYPLGGGQGILIDWETGTLSGGSDPRKDGCAIGY